MGGGQPTGRVSTVGTFQRPTRPSSHKEQRARVLVVEDSFLNRRVAEDALIAADYQVDAVSDGHEAVEALQKADFDVVLMDLDLPTMDGYAAARAIRELPGPNRAIRILAVSAHAMRKDVDLCMGNGMDGHISKPYSVDRLLGAVAECLAARGS